MIKSIVIPCLFLFVFQLAYGQNPENDLGDGDVTKMKITIKTKDASTNQPFEIFIMSMVNTSRMPKFSKALTPADSKYIELDVKGGRYDKKKGTWVFESCEKLFEGGLTVEAKKAGAKEYIGYRDLSVRCNNNSQKVLAKKLVESPDQKKARLKAELNLEYWKTGKVTPVVASKSNLYGFKNLDTLQYANVAQKNLGIIKSADKFIRVTSYSNQQPDVNGFVSSHGYSLNVSKPESLRKPLKTEKTSVNFDLPSSISINDVKETPSGYVVCSIDMIIFYDKQGNKLSVLSDGKKQEGKLFVDVTEIGATGDYIYAYYSFSKYGTNLLEIKRYNPKTKRDDWDVIQNIILPQDKKVAYMKAYKTKLHVIDNDYFIIAYNLGYEQAGIAKFKLSGFDDSRFNKALVWQINDLSGYNWETSSFVNKKLTLFTGANTSNGFELNAYSAFVNADTKESFKSSMRKLNRTNLLNESLHGIYPQANGEFIIFAEGEGKYDEIDVIYHYTNRLKLKGAYRMHYPLKMDAADRGYVQIVDYLVSRNFRNGTKQQKKFINLDGFHYGRFWNKVSNEVETNHSAKYPNGLIYKPIKNLETDPDQFFKYHNAFDFALDGSSLYIMTPFAVVKANMKNVTPVNPNYN